MIISSESFVKSYPHVDGNFLLLSLFTYKKLSHEYIFIIQYKDVIFKFRVNLVIYNYNSNVIQTLKIRKSCVETTQMDQNAYPLYFEYVKINTLYICVQSNIKITLLR